MNLILVNRGYCVVSIPPILRHDYITALQQAQRAQGPSDTAFIRLIVSVNWRPRRTTAGCSASNSRSGGKTPRSDNP